VETSADDSASAATSPASAPPPAPTPAALIVESTFTSVASFSARMLVPSVLVKSPFRTDRVLPKFEFPVLIMHGTQDDIIPVEHGRALAALRPDSEYIEMAGRHNDFPLDWDAYWNHVDTFLERFRE
jgi:pimeloyl-ACP methyl ester carboxylesterase